MTGNTMMGHYRSPSEGNVPFSWEKKPGISKVHHQGCPKELPLPPCPSESPKVLGHDLQIPLPPCPFLQFHSRRSSRKGLRQQEDPFLAAYKECTKSNKFASNEGKSSGRRSGVLTSLHLFSCKHSCDVRDDGLLRLSRLPHVSRERHKMAI